MKGIIETGPQPGGQTLLCKALYSAIRQVPSTGFSVARQRQVVNERLESVLQFIAGAPKGFQLRLFSTTHNGIVDAPVNSLDRSGKYRAALVGVIANRDHVIELLI